MWRKTRSVHEYCPHDDCTTRPHYGVDANRNFGFHWNEVGSSMRPEDEDYAGPRPFSEPETAALRDHVIQHAPYIDLYISLHSYGNMIMYPWGYTSKLPYNWEELHSLASSANDAQMMAGGSRYEIGSSTRLLYSAAGGSDDWVMAVGGVRLAYTVELPGGGDTGFDPPATDIEPTVRTFWPAVRAFAQPVCARALTD